MLKYNGYLIITEPDYKEVIANGDVVDDLWCGVYDEKDIDMKQMLGDFNIVRNESFKKCSKEDIENAIREAVMEDVTSYELVRKTNEMDRLKFLFTNATEYITESVGQHEAVTVLKESVGMTDEEIMLFTNFEIQLDDSMKMQ